jgi:hypothetical protein
LAKSKSPPIDWKMTGPAEVASENLIGITAFPVDLKVLAPSVLIGC